MMKTFRLKADTTFRAENIDDAFNILSEYFKALSTGNTEWASPFEDGEVTIEPTSSPESRTE